VVGRSPALAVACVGGACEVEQVGAFGLVELQCARQCLQNGLGHAPEVSSLQPCVVVGAHVGEESDLFAAWAGDATVAAVEP